MESIITVEDLNKLLHNPVAWVLVMWVVREIYNFFKKRDAEIISKMSELTIAIVRLQTKLENIERMAYSVPKLEKDMNAIHSKFRQFAPDSTSTEN